MKARCLSFVCTLLVLSIAAPHTLAIDAANGKHKVVFLAGNPSHGYGAHDHLAGCMLLAKSLDEKGLPIETQVYHYGWPEDPKLLADADCVVMYGDGRQGCMAMNHLAELDALAKNRVGIVCL